MKKNLAVINISLGLLAIFLFLNLIGLKLPTLGQASYWLDQSEPVCVGNYQDKYNLLDDPGSCCLELQKQLRCDPISKKIIIEEKELSIDRYCYVGESTINYFVNNKQYNYCKKEGILGYRMF